MFFTEIVERETPFSDWGALVLSKQIRLFETFLCSLLVGSSSEADHVDDGANAISTAPIISSFGKIAQVCAVLQLEKPSDWSAMRYTTVGDCFKQNLEVDEIRKVMCQRVDFSKDTVDKVCRNLEQSKGNNGA